MDHTLDLPLDYHECWTQTLSAHFYDPMMRSFRRFQRSLDWVFSNQIPTYAVLAVRAVKRFQPRAQLSF
jgi:hypothetical protein